MRARKPYVVASVKMSGQTHEGSLVMSVNACYQALRGGVDRPRNSLLILRFRRMMRYQNGWRQALTSPTLAVATRAMHRLTLPPAAACSCYAVSLVDHRLKTPV